MEIDDLGAAATVEQLPFEVRWPTQRGLDLWKSGQLDHAKANLEIALATARALGSDLGVFHAQHLRAGVAFSEGDYALARSLHAEALGLCHELGFLGGMGSTLCDLAMVDLAVGDVDGARVRFERGLACYEEGGYLGQAATRRVAWAHAAAS